jgi:thioredoxin 2
MNLDPDGVLVECSSCQTINRLKYGSLERATKCGKCHTPLPFPAEPIALTGTQLFDAAIGHASMPVVVDFWAEWCGPCHMMAPEIDKVAQRTAGRALVLKVDTDANPDLSQRYLIRSIPTIAIFQDGREVDRVAGVQPAAAIEQLLTRHSHAG